MAEINRTNEEIDALFEEFSARFLPSWPSAAVYARYSTDFQHSAVDQIRGCLEEAVRRGLRVRRELIFFDLAISGTKIRRPGLQALQAAVGKKTFSTLLVLTTNRLYRKAYKCMQFVVEELVERGMRAIFVKSGIDTADTLKWGMFLQMSAMMDEQGSVMYAGNIRAAHEGMFDKGWVITSLPFGYHGIPTEGPLTKRQRPRLKIGILEEEASWVRKIFHWFVRDRLPMARILEKLNTENAPANPKGYGEFWSLAALRYLLENAAYRGCWSYGKGHNQWQHKADYSKRVLREKPLREKQFDHLRLVDDEIWHQAQTLLAGHAGRGGRKPRDGDRATRPRILNGLLKCEIHETKLKVCGDKGQWMACPVCRTLPKDVRPLHTYMPRALATRMVCEAVARLIREDDRLVELIVESARETLARQGRPDPNRIGEMRRKLDKNNQQIRFVLCNPGETAEDEKTSRELLSQFREEARRIQADLDRLEPKDTPPAPPGEEEIRQVINNLGELFCSSGDESMAGPLREALELVTGGEILAEQMGEKRKFHGWLRLRFRPRVIELLRHRLPDGMSIEDEILSELIIDVREDRIAEAHADQVKELADQGHLYTRIAEMLGIERHQVSDALRIWHERHELPVPKDGRRRRGETPNGNMAPTKAMLFADDAKGLYDAGFLIDQIAEQLKADRGTIRSALRIAFAKIGETLPDGRHRRKSLEIKNRPREERESPSNGDES